MNLPKRDILKAYMLSVVNEQSDGMLRCPMNYMQEDSSTHFLCGICGTIFVLPKGCPCYLYDKGTVLKKVVEFFTINVWRNADLIDPFAFAPPALELDNRTIACIGKRIGLTEANYIDPNQKTNNWYIKVPALKQEDETQLLIPDIPLDTVWIDTYNLNSKFKSVIDKFTHVVYKGGYNIW